MTLQGEATVHVTLPGSDEDEIPCEFDLISQEMYIRDEREVLDDKEDVITLRQSLEDQLLVKEEQIV
jgi:hypothetical protein